MSMIRPGLAFLPNATGYQEPQILSGTIQKTPGAFTDTLHVGFRWAPGLFWEVTDWPACHGATLPTAGAKCLVMYDDQRNLRCVWWDGTFSEPTPSAIGAAAVANNLADLSNEASARTNLGLGSAATHSATDFLQDTNNLSDVVNATTALNNLGLAGGTCTISHTSSATGSVVVAGLPFTPSKVVATARAATLSALNELYADTYTASGFTLHDVYASSGTFSVAYSYIALA